MALPIIERLSGAVDGVNTIFETSVSYVPGSLRVFSNGLLGMRTLDDGWTELGGRRVRLNIAPLAVNGEDVLQAYFLPL